MPRDLDEPAPGMEQQLENLTENAEDAESEDDAFLQQMAHFIKDPVNLNTATESDLKELMIFTPLQIQNLISYRNLFGNFITIYELQAIPAWNISLIRKIRPYVTVTQRVLTLNTVENRLRGGEKTVLVRVTQVLEKSKGYKLDSITANNFYPGSPQKILLRYKYQYKNLLQYGITA